MRIHPNRHRGEIAVRLDGETRLLCLTLGALAELETAFGAANLAELAERFESGRLSAGDIIKIVGAGLRGAGNIATDEDVAQMSTEGGVAGFAKIAAELLWATFGGAAPDPKEQSGNNHQPGNREGDADPHVPQAVSR